MQFITLGPLVVPLLRLGAIAQSLQVINSIDLSVLKFNYYLNQFVAELQLKTVSIIIIGNFNLLV